MDVTIWSRFSRFSQAIADTQLFHLLFLSSRIDSLDDILPNLLNGFGIQGAVTTSFQEFRDRFFRSMQAQELLHYKYKGL
jgi:hypothetical protein